MDNLLRTAGVASPITNGEPMVERGFPRVNRTARIINLIRERVSVPKVDSDEYEAASEEIKVVSLLKAIEDKYGDEPVINIWWDEILDNKSYDMHTGTGSSELLAFWLSSVNVNNLSYKGGCSIKYFEDYDGNGDNRIELKLFGNDKPDIIDLLEISVLRNILFKKYDMIMPYQGHYMKNIQNKKPCNPPSYIR